MPACTNYPLLKTHDPDGTRLRTIKALLDPGDSLLGTTTLVPVDAANQEIIGGDFTVTVVAMGLISASHDGDIWGINYYLRGGAARLDEDPLPMIRLRPFLASQPSEPAYDQTFRVAIQQT